MAIRQTKALVYHCYYAPSRTCSGAPGAWDGGCSTKWPSQVFDLVPESNSEVVKTFRYCDGMTDSTKNVTPPQKPEKRTRSSPGKKVRTAGI